MLSRSRSEKTLILFFNIISFVMLAAFSLIVYQQARENRDYDDWILQTYEVLRVAHRSVDHAHNIQSAYRGYFLTGSSNFINSATENIKRTQEDFIRLHELTKESSQQTERVDKIHRHFDQFIQQQDVNHRRYAASGSTGLVIADIQKGQSLMNDLREEREIFINQELSVLGESIQNVREDQSYQVSTVITGAAIAIIGLIVSNILIILLLSSGAKTAKRLRDVEELYKIVLDNTSDGLYDIDIATRKMKFSPSFYKQLGFASEEIPTDFQGILKFVHPEDRELIQQKLEDYLSGKSSHYSLSYRMRHKTLEWVWVLSRATKLTNKLGMVSRIVGVHTDISEQKKKEEELLDLNNELESFTYIASHDLRSPLVNLKGFSKEIEEAIQKIRLLINKNDAVLPPSDKTEMNTILERDVDESLSFINSSVERMDLLTSAILNLSRIGRRTYTQECVDMNSVAKRCADTSAYEIGNKKTTITIDDLPEIYTDPLAIEQVLGNVLDNAIKYLDPSRPGQISIYAIETAHETIYSIQDNGLGIDKADSSKVFDIFRRARNSTGVRGIGMGLAFVRATIRKLGGRIWFESESGVGTTFHIALPVRKKGLSE